MTLIKVKSELLPIHREVCDMSELDQTKVQPMYQVLAVKMQNHVFESQQPFHFQVAIDRKNTTKIKEITRSQTISKEELHFTNQTLKYTSWFRLSPLSIPTKIIISCFKTKPIKSSIS